MLALQDSPLCATMQVSAGRACSRTDFIGPFLICNRSNKPHCLWHGCGLLATSLASPVCRLSAPAMQPSRALFEQLRPQPLLVVEDVATPVSAEPASGVRTPAGNSIQPAYRSPSWSLILSRTGGVGGGQHGSLSAPHARAIAQASAGVVEGCRSTQQGLNPVDLAATSQQGLSPAGCLAKQGSGSVLPPANFPQHTEPAGRLVGQATTFNANSPLQVVLPSSNTAAPQPGATAFMPAQQAAAGEEAALAATSAMVSNTRQAMPGLSPPLTTSTKFLFRHRQTAAFQSAQRHRPLSDDVTHPESNHPHSPLQRQPDSFHQPGPSHGAAALQQHQTLPTQRHELLPTQPSGSASAARLQQPQIAHVKSAEQEQTGLWGGQQPAPGQDQDVHAPAHGKAQPLQSLRVISELQQVLLQVY